MTTKYFRGHQGIANSSHPDGLLAEARVISKLRHLDQTMYVYIYIDISRYVTGIQYYIYIYVYACNAKQ